MIKKINNIFCFSFVAALLLAISIFPSGNASAEETNVSVKETNVSADSSAEESISLTSAPYVTVHRTFSSFPPGQILHVEWYGAFKYSGYLSLYSYAYDPDAGLYFATYKGEILPD